MRAMLLLLVLIVPDRTATDPLAGYWDSIDAIEDEYSYRIVKTARNRYRLDGNYPGKGVLVDKKLTVTWDYIPGEYQFYGEYELVGNVWQGHYWWDEDYKTQDTWRKHEDDAD